MSIFPQQERFPDGLLPARVSDFEYLCLSDRAEAARVRSLIDVWVESFPTDQRDKLVADIRTDDDIRHRSAIWELAVYRLLLSSGSQIVAVEPSVGTKGKKPDFLCRSTDGVEFVIECTDARGQSNTDRAREKLLYDVISAVNEIPIASHRVWFTYSRFPKNPVAKSAIKRPLEDWLKTLSEDDDHNTGKRLKIEIDGVHYRFTPIRAGNRKGNLIGVWSASAMCRSNQPDSLRRNLRKKASKYGELGLPYIVAINSPSFAHPHQDLFDVLFGAPAVVIDPAGPDDDGQEVRLANGLWRSGAGPTNRRLTGILLANNLNAWAIAQRKLWYFENPFPRSPMPNPFPSIARIGVERDEIELKEGALGSQVFSLDPSWPE